MESTANVAAAPAPDVQSILQKETWTHEDAGQLYKAFFAMQNAADRFREAANRLLADNPQPSGATAVKAGIAQYMLGDFTAAAKTLAGGTDNKDRRWYQAQCYKQIGQYAKAIEEFQRAADKGWDALAAKLAIGECHCLAGNIDAAAKLIAPLSAQAGVSDYQIVKGMIFEAQGNPDDAEEAYGEALDLDTTNSNAAFRLAFLYDRYGDESQAVELYSQCLRNPPVASHALMNLAVLYEDNGQWDMAEQCLRMVLSVLPNHGRARLYLRDVQSSRTMFYDEEQERRATQRNAVLDIPVTDFELSVRARNCLKKMDIRTLGDLLRITEAELLASKNFGETSLAEIKTMLSQKGLRLGQDVEVEIPVAPVNRPGPAAANAGNEGVLSTPVAEIELSVRSRKALQRLTIGTLGELASHSESDLLTCKNFGQTSLNEIKQRLADYGLALRDHK